MTDQEYEKAILRDIKKLEEQIEGLKLSLEKHRICMREGHVHPETSVGFYFCMRCSSYLG